MAIRRMVQDGERPAAEEALENYGAYLKLAHGPMPRPRTLARIGLSLGMNVVDAKKIERNADRLAQRMRGTVVEQVSGNGDVGVAWR